MVLRSHSHGANDDDAWNRLAHLDLREDIDERESRTGTHSGVCEFEPTQGELWCSA